MLAIAIIVGLVCLLAGAGLGYLARRRSLGTELQQAEEQASRIVSEAESRQKGAPARSERGIASSPKHRRRRVSGSVAPKPSASNSASFPRKKRSTTRSRTSNAANRPSATAKDTSKSCASRRSSCAPARRRDSSASAGSPQPKHASSSSPPSTSRFARKRTAACVRSRRGRSHRRSAPARSSRPRSSAYATEVTSPRPPSRSCRSPATT